MNTFYFVQFNCWKVSFSYTSCFLFSPVIHRYQWTMLAKIPHQLIRAYQALTWYEWLLRKRWKRTTFKRGVMRKPSKSALRPSVNLLSSRKWNHFRLQLARRRFQTRTNLLVVLPPVQRRKTNRKVRLRSASSSCHTVRLLLWRWYEKPWRIGMQSLYP